jgi:sialic acid synthase SpsE
MGTIKIGDRIIGTDREPFIIAEAGINHNGDMELAKKMIVTAKKAGADAVKFQTFYAKDFIKDRKTLFTYRSQGKEITEPIIDMFERCEFTPDEWREIAGFCKETGIMFLSTPGNVSDLQLLLSIGINAIKVGSDDFINIPLIKEFAKPKLPLLLACGMAGEEEIEETLKAAEELVSAGKVCVLLCTSEYPTPPADVNVLRITTLRNKYPDIAVGFSDHTSGCTASIMAAALGACVFEKHFTMSHDLPGSDHWFSEDPVGLKQWVDSIREAHKMRGNSTLRPTEAEMKSMQEAHRSITALTDIKKGEAFSGNNLCMRRPAEGLAPREWDNVVGKRASRDIAGGEQITWGDII